MFTVKSQHFFNRYLKFIEYCRNTSKGEYTEKHHIIPKSMGGSDDSNNLILLTGREHFISHILLWKSFQNRQTNFALWSMRMKKERLFQLSSKNYESLRQEHSKFQSEKMRENNPMYNTLTKNKISNHKKGKKLKEETKRKMSIVRKGVPKTEETKQKMSSSAKGKPKTTEHKLSLSLNHRDVSGNKNPMYGKSAIRDKKLKWYTNGTESKFLTEDTQPIGWIRGRKINR